MDPKNLKVETPQKKAPLKVMNRKRQPLKIPQKSEKKEDSKEDKELESQPHPKKGRRIKKLALPSRVLEKLGKKPEEQKDKEKEEDKTQTSENSEAKKPQLAKKRTLPKVHELLKKTNDKPEEEAEALESQTTKCSEEADTLPQSTSKKPALKLHRPLKGVSTKKKPSLAALQSLLPKEPSSSSTQSQTNNTDNPDNTDNIEKTETELKESSSQEPTHSPDSFKTLALLKNKATHSKKPSFIKINTSSSSAFQISPPQNDHLTNQTDLPNRKENLVSFLKGEGDVQIPHNLHGKKEVHIQKMDLNPPSSAVVDPPAAAVATPVKKKALSLRKRGLPSITPEIEELLKITKKNPPKISFLDTIIKSKKIIVGPSNEKKHRIAVKIYHDDTDIQEPLPSQSNFFFFICVEIFLIFRFVI